MKKDCPELLIAALEDTTIELALIQKLILGIAANADSMANDSTSKPPLEHTH